MLFQDIITILTDAEMMKYYLDGFLNTLSLTVLAALIGLLLGFIVAIIKISAANYKFMKKR